MTDLIVRVKLWGELVGSLVWDETLNCAAFVQFPQRVYPQITSLRMISGQSQSYKASAASKRIFKEFNRQFHIGLKLLKSVVFEKKSYRRNSESYGFAAEPRITL